jgi:hypothetical protein
MTAIPRFLPSTHGLPFRNSWPHGTPDKVVHLPVLGDVPIGDASNGLCGGMAFTAADLYLAGLRPPDGTEAPAGQSALFDYLFDRLLASFDLPAGVLAYYYWAITPGHDTGFWVAKRRGLAWLTVREQLPKVTAAIDHGEPVGLGLVTVSSWDPGNLKRCHQVLAYGYDWAGPRITLRVYDPNQPGDDSVTISLDTSRPTKDTPIDSTVDCDPVRGFFASRYRRADPSAIAGQPWA